MTKTKQTDQSLQHQVLDPSLLGRPIHLLHTFAMQLREDFSQAFRMSASRRYWASFQVEDVAMTRTDGAQGAGRWIAYTADAGTLVFSLERSLLLSVLNYRYGRREGKAEVQAQTDTPRITATEERLAVTLGQQLVATLAARIEVNQSGSGEGLNGALKPPAAQPMKPAPAPARGSWMITLTVRDLGTNQLGRLWFGLDQPWMGNVLRGLGSTRDKSRTVFQGTPALASHIQVKLSGRLVSQQVALGDLLDIRVGDVIPVNLGRADVLLENSRLFTAAVTEHKGKLCLTSFEDAE